MNRYPEGGGFGFQSQFAPVPQPVPPPNPAPRSLFGLISQDNQETGIIGQQFSAANTNAANPYQAGNVTLQQTQYPPSVPQNTSNVFMAPSATVGDFSRNRSYGDENNRSQGSHALGPYQYGDNFGNAPGTIQETGQYGPETTNKSRFYEEGRGYTEAGKNSVKKDFGGFSENRNTSIDTQYDDYFKYGFGQGESNVHIPSSVDAEHFTRRNDPTYERPQFNNDKYYERSKHDNNYMPQSADARRTFDSTNLRFRETMDYASGQAVFDPVAPVDVPGKFHVPLDSGNVDDAWRDRHRDNVDDAWRDRHRDNREKKSAFDEAYQFQSDNWPPRNDRDTIYSHLRDDRDQSHTLLRDARDQSLTHPRDDMDQSLTHLRDARDQSLTHPRDDMDQSLTHLRDARDQRLTHLRDDMDQSHSRLRDDRDQSSSHFRDDRDTHFSYLKHDSYGKMDSVAVADRSSDMKSDSVLLLDKAIAESKKRLARLERGSMGRARSRDRLRSGSRERRRTTRSRSRERLRDRRGWSRERGSNRRDSRQDSGSKVAEDPFEEAHRLFVEERERKWEKLKADYNLTDAERGQHPMFMIGSLGGYGYICKDCNITEMETTAFGKHLASENHLQVVQRRSHDEPLKDREGTGDRESRSPRGRRSQDRDRDRFEKGLQDSGRNRTRSQSGDKTTSRHGVEKETLHVNYTLAKPKGPLKVRKTSGKSLCLEWGAVKLPKNGYYLVECAEYKTGARMLKDDQVIPNTKLRWRKLGASSKCNFRAIRLKIGTSYKFRVMSVYGNTESTPLMSNPIKTDIVTGSTLADQERKEQDQNAKKIEKQDRNAKDPHMMGGNLGNNADEPKEAVKKSLESEKSKTKVEPVLTKQVIPVKDKQQRKSAVKNKPEMIIDLTMELDEPVREKEPESMKKEQEPVKKNLESMKKDHGPVREKDQDSIIKGHEPVKNKPESMKKDHGPVREKEQETMKNQRNLNELKSMEEEKKMEVEGEKPKCFFYENFKGKLNPAWIGLQYVTEIQHYDPTVEPNYTCDLCFVSLGPSDIYKHVKNTTHLMNYFEKHHVDEFVKLNKLNVQQKTAYRVGRLLQSKDGYGAINVVQMRNSRQQGSTSQFSDPVSIPAPKLTEDSSKDVKTGPVSEFNEFLQEEQLKKVFENGEESSVNPVLGLQFITEYVHPTREPPPQYECDLCKKFCLQYCILPHILGQVHMLNYIDKMRPDLFEKLKSVTDLKEHRAMLNELAEEIEETMGHETVTTVEAKDEKTIDEEEGEKVIHHFDNMMKIQEAKWTKSGEGVKPALGLQFVYELHHPELLEVPRFSCTLCNLVSRHVNILNHIYGKTHQLNYMKRNHPDIYEEIGKLRKRKSEEEIKLCSKDIIEKFGRKTISYIRLKSTKLWEERPAVKDKTGNQEEESVTDPQQKTGTIKNENSGSQEVEMVPAVKATGADSQVKDDTPIEARVYVGNISHTTDKEDLALLMKDFNYKNIRLVIDDKNKNNIRSYGFVDMASKEEAERCIRELNGKEFKSKPIKVAKCTSQPKLDKGTPPDSVRVYIRNFPVGVSQVRFKQDMLDGRKFRFYNFKIALNHRNGKRYAFLDLKSQKEAKRCIAELNGATYRGQTLLLTYDADGLTEDTGDMENENNWDTVDDYVKKGLMAGSIVKCKKRPCKFHLEYSASVKKHSYIGLQWVTEFQRPDKTIEPWYLCYLCQSRIEWNSIESHIISVQHRMNYMKKSYTNMYHLLPSQTQHDSDFGNRVEEYAKRIEEIEEMDGNVKKMEVMMIEEHKNEGENRRIVQLCIKCHETKSLLNAQKACGRCCGCFSEDICPQSCEWCKIQWSIIKDLKTTGTTANKKTKICPHCKDKTFAWDWHTRRLSCLLCCGCLDSVNNQCPGKEKWSESHWRFANILKSIFPARSAMGDQTKKTETKTVKDEALNKSTENKAGETSKRKRKKQHAAKVSSLPSLLSLEVRKPLSHAAGTQNPYLISPRNVPVSSAPLVNQPSVAPATAPVPVQQFGLQPSMGAEIESGQADNFRGEKRKDINIREHESSKRPRYRKQENTDNTAVEDMDLESDDSDSRQKEKSDFDVFDYQHGLSHNLEKQRESAPKQQRPDFHVSGSRTQYPDTDQQYGSYISHERRSRSPLHGSETRSMSALRGDQWGIDQRSGSSQQWTISQDTIRGQNDVRSQDRYRDNRKGKHMCEEKGLGRKSPTGAEIQELFAQGASRLIQEKETKQTVEHVSKAKPPSFSSHEPEAGAKWRMEKELATKPKPLMSLVTEEPRGARQKTGLDRDRNYPKNKEEGFGRRSPAATKIEELFAQGASRMIQQEETKQTVEHVSKPKPHSLVSSIPEEGAKWRMEKDLATKPKPLMSLVTEEPRGSRQRTGMDRDTNYPQQAEGYPGRSSSPWKPRGMSADRERESSSLQADRRGFTEKESRGNSEQQQIQNLLAQVSSKMKLMPKEERIKMEQDLKRHLPKDKVEGLGRRGPTAAEIQELFAQGASRMVHNEETKQTVEHVSKTDDIGGSRQRMGVGRDIDNTQAEGFQGRSSLPWKPGGMSVDRDRENSSLQDDRRGLTLQESRRNPEQQQIQNLLAQVSSKMKLMPKDERDKMEQELKRNLPKASSMIHEKETKQTVEHVTKTRPPSLISHIAEEGPKWHMEKELRSNPKPLTPAVTEDFRRGRQRMGVDRDINNPQAEGYPGRGSLPWKPRGMSADREEENPSWQVHRGGVTEQDSRGDSEQQQIQNLLAQVTSKMKLMPKDEREKMEQELKRNLPQVPLSSSLGSQGGQLTPVSDKFGPSSSQFAGTSLGRKRNPRQRQKKWQGPIQR